MDIKDAYLHGTVGVVKSINLKDNTRDTLTYTLADAVNTTYDIKLLEATTTHNGLLSSADKRKLDAFTDSTNYAVSKLLTNEDLNDIINPGFYNAGGGNTVDNSPLNSGTHFGLEVIHGAIGAYYVLILYQQSYSNLVWRRHCYDGAWSPWTLDELTDTTYTFADGTSGNFTVTPLGGTAQTVSIGKPSTAGTADTALKLETTRTLWGLAFDGSLNVAGSLSDVTSINMNGDIVINDGNNNDRYIKWSYNNTDQYGWRIGYLGDNAHSNDNNALVFLSYKGTAGWDTALKFDHNSMNAVFSKNVTASSFIGKIDGYYVKGLTGYQTATESEAITTEDTLNEALGKLEYKADSAYNWILEVTSENDTDEYINKWGEIVDFLNSIEETDDDGNPTDILNEFVTRKTDQTITGLKTFTNQVIIHGLANSKPLMVRGIVSSDGSGNVGPLYLLYNVNQALHLGNAGTHTISADGSLYSGTSTYVTVGTRETNAYRAIVVHYGNGLYSAGTGTGKPQYNYSTGDVKAYSFTTAGGYFNGTAISAKALLRSNGNTLGDTAKNDDECTDYPLGLTVQTVYLGGFPTSWGNVLTINSTNAAGGGGNLIFVDWGSVSTSDPINSSTVNMYIRGRRDNYTAWSGWTKVITDKNYTSVLNNTYLSLTGGTLTGDLTIKKGSGEKPGIVFQRAETNDTYEDWKIVNDGGSLKIQNRNSSGSFADVLTLTSRSYLQIKAGSTGLNYKFVGNLTGNADTATSATSARYAKLFNCINLPSSTDHAAGTVWCKFATVTFNQSAWSTASGFFFFSGGENPDHRAILSYHFRSDSIATEPSRCALQWLVKSNDTLQVIAVKVEGNVYDLYVNNQAEYCCPLIYYMSNTYARVTLSAGTWSTTKPTAAYTSTDIGRVNYANSAGSAVNADTVDNLHASSFYVQGRGEITIGLDSDLNLVLNELPTDISGSWKVKRDGWPGMVAVLSQGYKHSNRGIGFLFKDGQGNRINLLTQVDSIWYDRGVLVYTSDITDDYDVTTPSSSKALSQKGANDLFNTIDRKWYIVDASDSKYYSTSNFYPITFPSSGIETNCEIHSPSLAGTHAYNQNYIHFLLTALGWSDTPKHFIILALGVYSSTEITIGGIGYGNRAGILCIWVRGGMKYRILCNKIPTLHSTSYTSNNETFSVGPNYTGETNTNVTTVWTYGNNNNQVATLSNIPTSLPANGGNADTLDGVHASGLLTALSSGTTNAISITVGGTTKNIEVSTLKINLSLGNVQNTAFYKRSTSVNGTSWDMAGTNSNNAFTIYAPTESGTDTYILTSAGEKKAPIWKSPGETMINIIASLSEGSSNVTDYTEILTSYASNNGFADANATNRVYKRSAIKLYNYIKDKLDDVYQAKGDYLTSRGHIGTTAVLASPAIQALTGIGNITPGNKNSYNIGTLEYKWKNIYADTMYAASAFYLYSDVRLKTNIQKLSKDLLDKVYDINEVSFDWKESGKEAFGYIALDYEAISKTFVDRQDNGTLTLDYTKALVVQIAALKLKISELESRIQILEN